ncbi:MbcA/ParS/Xre antitoxin family protein [Gordonia sp. SL306]|uniref:MbcA/ParS/Xre antitoxin family protein n=1 Tax=Gordonia sp. SL306 TaxID=2995145 RepID=UPI00226FEB62|nr:MbcA/ParS/Xre antitoxin family protein [Gordonia sp. SL306]WAC54604.1 MbcA/ParS/Xre antitoxin family protein [Gordonia sp. SL306]
MTTARVSDLPKKSRRPGSRSADRLDPLAPSRVGYLADSFGKARLAELIGVSRSQPTRWISGEEFPGPIAAPLLIDLEHVYARARLIWGEQAAQTWLTSQNAHLGGARPIDALKQAGAAGVLTALDAESWGGAA